MEDEGAGLLAEACPMLYQNCQGFCIARFCRLRGWPLFLFPPIFLLFPPSLLLGPPEAHIFISLVWANKIQLHFL
jgi:hypothetical protein